jgi:putative SOS response-associated peptidase YedK
MCGRYTLLATADDLAEEFAFGEPITLAPRYNVAPSQDVPVVRLSEPDRKRRLEALHWGLVPHWAKDPKIGYRTINARAETVATQPAFRDAFRKRRCIVPANGFYEWQRVVVRGKEAKQPYYVHRKDGRPMGLAGLWDRWVAPDGEVLESFTIVTTEANELVQALHNRMPVILRPEDYALWLDPAARIEQLRPLLAPCPSDWLEATPVSREVNNPRNDGPGCIAPVR